MEKEINFTGVNLTPYSDVSPDGQLSVCSGLERYNGSLRPTVLNGTEYKVNVANAKLIYVHNTVSFSNFIFYVEESGLLYWCAQSAGGNLSLRSFASLEGITSVNSVGNTLILINGEGLNYYVFSSNTYKDLGDWPVAVINFGLQGYCYKTSTITIQFDDILGPDRYKEWTDNNKRIITSAVMPMVNQFIEQYKTEGKFMSPFFVRYAFRLYDGTLTHHSSPVLMMLPFAAPIALAQLDSEWGEDNNFSRAGIFISGIACNLDYCWSPVSSEQSKFNLWSDIIKSVDIFISNPISPIFPDGQCTQFSIPFSLTDNYAVCRHMNYGGSSQNLAADNYQCWSWNALYRRTFNGDPQRVNYINLPYKGKAAVEGEIVNEGNFYFLASLSTSVNTNRNNVSIGRGVLNNIVFNERMSDDYDSHDKLIAQNSFNYNGRLVLANISKVLFNGLSADSLFCYNGGGYLKYESDIQETFINSKCKLTYETVIKHEGKTYIVNNKSSALFFNKFSEALGTANYVFFPNIEAATVYLRFYDELLLKYYNYGFTLKKHPSLNGSYCFIGFGRAGAGGSSELPDRAEVTVSYPNKIYTSQVNNPFFFPLAGINTVGIGNIVGISTVAVPLSQGQFGIFPLMVFCTDGNYALEVETSPESDNIGLFSSIKPMPRDVCTNGRSITQTDASVLFISAKGVMIADGAVIKCISEALSGVQENVSTLAGKSLENLSTLSPVEFFQRCLVAYDYAGKRIIFLSSTETMAWVLSLTDGSWSHMDTGNILGVLNSYPYSYIQMRDTNQIIRLDASYNFSGSQKHEGLLVSRPVKLDSFQLKAIQQIALEGNYVSPQQISIYGSNDGAQWHLLGHSEQKRTLMRARSFKYWRFVIHTSLTEAENISGLRIGYEVRPEKRFR